VSLLPPAEQVRPDELDREHRAKVLHDALEHLQATGMDVRPIVEAAKRHEGHLEDAKDLIAEFSRVSPGEALVLCDWLLEGMIRAYAPSAPKGTLLELYMEQAGFPQRLPPDVLHLLTCAQETVLKARQRLLVWATEKKR
jgi:hypothetical protein